MPLNNVPPRVVPLKGNYVCFNQSLAKKTGIVLKAMMQQGMWQSSRHLGSLPIYALLKTSGGMRPRLPTGWKKPMCPNSVGHAFKMFLAGDFAKLDNQLDKEHLRWHKRSIPRSTFDIIAVPRGVPDEFKVSTQLQQQFSGGRLSIKLRSG